MSQLAKIYLEYQSVVTANQLDWQKFSEYAIVHHSNSIEGSTLTIDETILLLEEDVTPNGRPIEHTLMAVDHYKALQYVLALAKSKTPLTSDLIREISALTLCSTGSKISALAGDFDSSKGDFRKLTVQAGSRLFPDYKKVPSRVEELVNHINQQIKLIEGNIDEIYQLSFDAHFQLVSIHPFADGNGRVSRLLMNYVQHFHGLPLSIVFKEDKSNYINALEQTRTNENLTYFRDFMVTQTIKLFQTEIEKQNSKPKSKNIGGINFIF